MRNFFCSKINYLTTIIFSLISSIGIAQNNAIDSIYTLSLEDLLSIEVTTASKKSEKISDIPASIVLITREKIEASGYQSIEDIFANVTGMYQMNDYLWFGTDNFGVRGFYTNGTFSNIIILVNGVNQMEEWYNSFPTTKINVPVEAIDRIEVVRGPLSVIYGNSAFFGAINIITNESNKSIASAGIGNNGQYRAFGKAVAKNEIFTFTANAGVYGNYGIDEPWEKMNTVVNPNGEWGDIPPTSKGQLEDHRKYFDFSLDYKGLFARFQQTATDRGVIDYYPGYDDGHLARIQTTNLVVGKTFLLNNNLSFTFKGGYYTFRNFLDYKHNSDSTAYTFNDIYSESFDLELNTVWTPSDKFNIITSGYYRKALRDQLTVDAPNLSVGYYNLDAGLSRKNSKYRWAIFTQAQYSIEKLSIVGGIRFEQTPKYDIDYRVRFDYPTDPLDPDSPGYIKRVGTYNYDAIEVIPRIGIIYHPNKSNHIKIMYGSAIKAPSIGQNMDIVRYPSRPQMEPSTIQTIELNYISTIGNYATINFSVFRNYADKLITRINSLTLGMINYSSGRLTTTGSELSLVFKPIDKLTINLSGMYQISTDKTEGYENIELNYSPKFLGYGNITYRPTKKLSANINFRYVDKMYPAYNISTTGDGTRIGDTAPAYTVFGLNLRVDNIIKDGIFASFSISNLLDTEIRYPVTRSQDYFDKGTLGYSRMFTINAGYKF
ncbi:MAG TPA: TonB-dependent receptor plug domain-containing protein [Tenuifilaceae bacterium]|nr:TonB-dependent receptor plug domain-containing protein [Tenuifilaceae bacterium]HPN22023.1 TonB-dependent receptor plug domain-containing protein [Tenuifilaceae bacterium]